MCTLLLSNARMVTPRNIDAYLKRRFYDPRQAGSFTSASKLYKAIRREGKYDISLKRIREWAEGQDILTLHKSVRQRQPAYRRIISPGLNHMWDADLLELSGRRFKQSNAGHAYILVTVDVFSRFCRAEAVKNKGATEMARAFSTIFRRSAGAKPRFLRSDRGVEFSNAKVQEVLREQGVKHYYSNTETKANFVEILIKTLKKRLFQYFQWTNSYAYVNELQAIVSSYNKTIHSSIGLPPAKVTADNELKVWDYQYVSNSRAYKDSLKRALKRSKAGAAAVRRRRFKFAVGQTVRVAHYRQKPWHRAYDEQFTGEVFTVRSRREHEGIDVYYLTDFGGDEVKGQFYRNELTAVRYDPNALFKIEKVLKSRVRNGVKEQLVKYQSWPARYNEWIAADAIVALRRGNRKAKRRRRRRHD